MKYWADGDHPDLQDHAPADVTLRLLATTDLHGFLAGYDYLADRPCREVGLTRVATLIERARAAVPNTLLFDNGDFLQGTPLVDYWARVRGLNHGEIHPMIAAMNALGYDAATLGNHEFNFGLDFAMRALEGARFPIVSANALRHQPAGGEQTLLPPWALLERELTDARGARHRLKIGVIGFLPPQTVQWDRALLAGRMRAQGIVEAAQIHVPALRAAGADLVIALAHTGIDPEGSADATDPETEHAALPLAAVAGIDALILGHTHECFPSPAAPAPPGADRTRGALLGKPAVQPGRWGSHLGLADLRLRHGADGRWGVADFAVALQPIARRTGPDRVVSLAAEAPALKRSCAPAHAETLGYIRRSLGQLATPLNSFFSLVAPDAGLSLIAAVQRSHVARRIAQRPEAALPLLSAVAPARCGGRGGPNFFVDIPAGPLRQKHIADLYAFPNTITAVRVSGRQIADWLERAAGVFARIRPGATDQPLLDPAFPCYNFDVIDGLHYEIDPTVPARFHPDGSLADPATRRIRDLRFAGRPLDPDQEFVVATNNYRASGAGGFAEATGPGIPLGPSMDLHMILAEAVQEVALLTPEPHPIWRFAAIPGASALFDTAPQAAAAPCPSGRTRIEEIGLTATGFLRYRLHFADESTG